MTDPTIPPLAGLQSIEGNDILRVIKLIKNNVEFARFKDVLIVVLKDCHSFFFSVTARYVVLSFYHRICESVEAVITSLAYSAAT
jgi:hypothetical protein